VAIASVSFCASLESARVGTFNFKDIDIPQVDFDGLFS
jgi:hypothetical protein